MKRASKWNPAVRHRDDDARAFIQEYFQDERRSVLFIAGAGFDPRSTDVARALAAAAAARTHAVLIRENRPSPAQVLVEAADRNASTLSTLFPQNQTVSIDVFARDGAVVGGRAAAQALSRIDHTAFTDVMIDVSALSIGVFFPLVKLMQARVEAPPVGRNLHLTITDNPDIDRGIEANFADAMVAPHGFQGQLELDGHSRAVRLWMPHLAMGKRSVLELVFRRVRPDDVCPILPFPASNPRKPEELMDHFLSELDGTWDVHERNLVYADESNPLDVYRTILRIDKTRSRIFKELGGSQLVLSPIGSKLLAVGTMLAAMERDFPVRYVEPVEFVPQEGVLAAADRGKGRLYHLWLAGEVYRTASPLGQPQAQ